MNAPDAAMHRVTPLGYPYGCSTRSLTVSSATGEVFVWRGNWRAVREDIARLLDD